MRRRERQLFRLHPVEPCGARAACLVGIVLARSAEPRIVQLEGEVQQVAGEQDAFATANSRTSSSSLNDCIHPMSAPWRWYRAFENRGIHPSGDGSVLQPVWSECTCVRMTSSISSGATPSTASWSSSDPATPSHRPKGESD